MWKRWIVVFVCLILITIRYIYPTFQIDTTTVGLVVVGAVAFLLPDLKSLVPYIRRIKIGEAELELRDEIEKLSNEVEKAFYTVNGVRITVYATGQNMAVKWGWRTPLGKTC